MEAYISSSIGYLKLTIIYTVNLTMIFGLFILFALETYSRSHGQIRMYFHQNLVSTIRTVIHSSFGSIRFRRVLRCLKLSLVIQENVSL